MRACNAVLVGRKYWTFVTNETSLTYQVLLTRCKKHTGLVPLDMPDDTNIVRQPRTSAKCEG